MAEGPVAGTFFTRVDCPLCEAAWAALEQAGVSARLRRKDIASDGELTRRYGWRIPVVALAGGNEFDIALEDQLVACLSALSADVAPS